MATRNWRDRIKENASGAVSSGTTVSRNTAERNWRDRIPGYSSQVPAGSVKSSALSLENGKTDAQSLSGAFKYGAEKVASGVLSGLEGIYKSGAIVNNALAGITSALGENPVSNLFKSGAEKALNTSWAEDYDKSIENKYKNVSNSQKLVGQLNQAAGNMAPSVATGILTGGASEAGLAVMAANAAGNNASEAYQQSGNLNKSLTYGALSAYLETATEKMFEGIPGLNKGVISSAINKVVKNGPVRTILDTLGEGAEEWVSSIVDPYLRRMTFDPNAKNATKKEQIESAVTGAVLSAVMQSGSAAGNFLADKTTGKVNTALPRNVQTAAQTEAAPQLNANVQANSNPEAVQKTVQTDSGTANGQISQNSVTAQELLKFVNEQQQTEQKKLKEIADIENSKAPTVQSLLDTVNQNLSGESTGTLEGLDNTNGKAASAQSLINLVKRQQRAETKKLQALSESEKTPTVQSLLDMLNDLQTQGNQTNTISGLDFGPTAAEVKSQIKGSNLKAASEDIQNSLKALARETGNSVQAQTEANNQGSSFVPTYVQNKKGPPATSDAKMPQTYTPETSSGPASSDTILPQNGNGVNSYSIPGNQNNSTMTKNEKNLSEPVEGAKINEQGEDITSENPEVREAIAEANETGISSGITPEISQNLNNSSLLGNKTLERVLDAVFGKKTERRKWAYENVELSLMISKKSYAKFVKSQLEKVHSEVVEKLGIKPGSKESAAVQWIGEGKRQINAKGETQEYTMEKLKEDFPDTWQNIVAADKIFRQMYDEYVDRLNAMYEKIYPNVKEKAQAKAESLQAEITNLQGKVNEAVAYGGMDNIDALQRAIYEKAKILNKLKKDIDSGEILVGKRVIKRKDYYHHFRELESGFRGLKNLLDTSQEIDPQLVGLSEFTKPKSKWTGFIQRRNGGVYAEDAVGGIVKYIPAAEYNIAINPVIANLRALTRDIQQQTAKTKNANNFILWLTHYANDLAGKTNPADRMVQNAIGRKPMKVLSTLNQRFNKNLVLGNLGTAISQFYNLPNSVAIIKNPADLANGAKDYTSYMIKGDKELKQLVSESGFLTERYLGNTFEKFDVGVLKKAENFAGWVTEFGDKQVAYYTWFAAAEQAKRQGITEPAKIAEYADRITRRAIAGRGIGEVPLWQKSNVINLFAPFQIEVNNSYQILKEMVGDKDALGIVLAFVTTWLMNLIRKQIDGKSTGMDLIGTAQDVMEEGGSAGDMAKRLSGEVLSNVPYGYLLTSAVIQDADEREKLFGDSDPTRYGTGGIGAVSAIAEPFKLLSGEKPDFLQSTANLLLPFGGKQAERSIKGMQDQGWLPKLTVSKDDNGKAQYNFGTQESAASYSDNAKLRFPIEQNPVNVTKNLLFGPYSTNEGQEYIKNGFPMYTQKETDKYKEAISMGIDGSEFLSLLNVTKLMTPTKNASGKVILTTNEKIKKYIDSQSGLTLFQKDWLYEKLKR